MEIVPQELRNVDERRMWYPQSCAETAWERRSEWTVCKIPCKITPIFISLSEFIYLDKSSGIAQEWHVMERQRQGDRKGSKNNRVTANICWTLHARYCSKHFFHWILSTDHEVLSHLHFTMGKLRHKEAVQGGLFNKCQSWYFNLNPQAVWLEPAFLTYLSCLCRHGLCLGAAKGQHGSGEGEGASYGPVGPQENTEAKYFPPGWPGFDYLFIFTQVFKTKKKILSKKAVRQMLKLWLACPCLAAVIGTRGRLRLAASGQACQPPGLAEDTHRGSRFLKTSPLRWPWLAPSSLPVSSTSMSPQEKDCLRKRKKNVSLKKKFNETKHLYFQLLTLDLCFSNSAIWDKSFSSSLHPMV